MTYDVQLRIIRALAYRGDAGWNIQDVNDSYHTLYYVIAGDGHVRTREGVTDLLPGHIYLIPRGICHDLWCDTHILKTYIDFHVELLPGYDALQGTEKVLSMEVGEGICRNMFEAVQAEGIREKTYVRGQVLTALSCFLPDSAADISPLMLSFLPVIEDVQKRLSASIRREEYAMRYGWNPSAFSRAFRKAFGVGFKEYVERLLTDRLVEEVLVTDKTLHAMAAEWGFCDAYYLSAFFKRRTGISPEKYRQTRSRSDVKKGG